MRSAKCRQEIIESILVRHVDDRQPSAPLESVAVEDVVIADRKVEKVSGLNARWVAVVVLSAWGWYFHEV